MDLAAAPIMASASFHSPQKTAFFINYMILWNTAAPSVAT